MPNEKRLLPGSVVDGRDGSRTGATATSRHGRRALRVYLENLYGRYNRRDFVHPDPLEFLYRYPDPGDREIVGLLASSLAYGRVAGILKSVEALLAVIGPSPRSFLLDTARSHLVRSFHDFRHRWTTGMQVASLLSGARRAIVQNGSLNACFCSGYSSQDETILPAMDRFVTELKTGEGAGGAGSLLPAPRDGSACKRLNLFLRWMVRRDKVDPGGWVSVPAAKLIVPLDVHMHRICSRLGLTARKQADLRTAMEITAAFRELCPDDPVRYDFAVTRPGIRGMSELDGAMDAGCANCYE